MNNNKKLIKEIKKVLLSIINKKSLSHNFGPSTEEIRECLKRINLILNSPDELIIDVFKKDIDWNYISVYLKLSEYFINYFYDKVEWWNISVHQKLSEKFIEKFQDKVQWEFIINNQKLSQEFIFKFWDTKLSKLKGKVLVLHKKVITYNHKGFFIGGDFIEGPIIILKDNEKIYRDSYYGINEKNTKESAYWKAHDHLRYWIEKDYRISRKSKNLLTEKLWFK